ncbi:MAG: polysaccharide deacetylase family protein [Pyrinomonadaceae bacterium]|nr:polysaccharide deacetylase family protein [Pyrinomonadaceae bacterium]
MKPIASLSLDLDNKWSYMKTHGDAGWESFPTYLDTVVPRSLAFLKERNLKITYFIVGQDAALEKNFDAIRQISEADHEIGNHSFKHEPWLHLYSKDELIAEFERTENALEKAAGKLPIGFRGPGYSLSPTVLEVLAERNYEYDCSTLPTYIAPLARAYYFFKSPEMSDEEREKRKKLFGKFSDGFQPLKPYKWQIGERTLTEIPVTTLPIFKTPIHFSYLLYLATFSELAAKIYFKTALRFCVLNQIAPSLLLHPLDFLDGNDAEELKFFPAMNLAAEKKMELISGFLADFQKYYELQNVRAHARYSIKNSKLKIKKIGDL